MDKIKLKVTSIQETIYEVTAEERDAIEALDGHPNQYTMLQDKPIVSAHAWFDICQPYA